MTCSSITNVSFSASFDDFSGHGRSNVDATLEALAGFTVAAFAEVVEREFPVFGTVLATLLLRLRFGRKIPAVEHQMSML
jgi:hypothetical protein